MNDPSELLLRAARASAFPANSRYQRVPVATGKDAAGRPVAYLRRRFVPPPGRFPAVGAIVVAEGDRADRLAAQALGDPEMAWRLCDANAVLSPEELTSRAGRVVRVPGPELPGGSGGA